MVTSYSASREALYSMAFDLKGTHYTRTQKKTGYRYLQFKTAVLGYIYTGSHLMHKWGFGFHLVLYMSSRCKNSVYCIIYI